VRHGRDDAWNRITAAIPDFLERYQDAIDADNER
jgi:hypothetical protein